MFINSGTRLKQSVKQKARGFSKDCFAPTHKPAARGSQWGRRLGGGLINIKTSVPIAKP